MKYPLALLGGLFLASLFLFSPKPALAVSGCCVRVGGPTPSCEDLIDMTACTPPNISYSGSTCAVRQPAECSGIFTPATTTTPPAATTGSSATVELPNPIACNDATCLIGQVVRYILGSIAVVATLMFVWGGVMMLTSGGNAEQVKRAKETLVWAAIGVVVILLSWLIIKTVLQALTNTSS